MKKNNNPQYNAIMNQQGKYVVCESTDYGCKVYNVVNTETGNRINYYPDYESAKEFAERQNKSRIYASLRINFTVWNIVGGVYGYKELIRIPRKKKKALKNSILRDIIKVDRTYIRECPQPNKLPTFSYKQNRKEEI